MEFHERRALLLESIDTALKALSTVPQDAGIVEAIERAQQLRQVVEAWSSTPDDDAIEDVEGRVLALHVAVASLKRAD